jgi:ATP-dependent Lon protease
LNTLDEKIKAAFPVESVYKTAERYRAFSGKSLPSFIKDWLIKKYSDEYGALDKDGLSSFMDNHIPQEDSAIKNRLRTHREQVKLLTRFIVETDIKNDKLKFSIPDLGIKSSEGRIPDYISKKHKELKDGEMWGVITLSYIPPCDSEPGVIELVEFKPFKPYTVDIEYYRDARKEFTTEEWIDLLIKSMEYNPGGFSSLTQKILFLSRLLIYLEPRLNMIELAPKGTGKSYVFGNLSKYGWLISGGIVTRAKLFYDIARNAMGIITMYDFVAMDEIQTIKFSDPSELMGALKGYLEFGVFSVANVRQASSAGLMLMGNIALDENKRPIRNKYFTELPEMFRESALLDRFHGFIQGWGLPRINESLKVKGYTLNVEYFSEILHTLREMSLYSTLVSELLDIPKTADTRDTTAVLRLATAYLKLFFPHVRSIEDIDKEDFNTYCLLPAIDKRRIIRRQIHLIDQEFKDEFPDIRIKYE